MAPPPEPEVTEEEEVEPEVPLIEPDEGTVEWIHWWRHWEGSLTSPINITITGSIVYRCPPLVWYNFDIFPHKLKLTNTGYTLILTGKWTTERPYLIDGPFLPKKKYIFSQLHFHWGAHMMEGSDHPVDNRTHPLEMHVVYFNSLYLTQEKAFEHTDGVVIMCYLIRFGVERDKRLDLVLDAFLRVREAQKSSRIGPFPLSRLLTMFVNDYFLYWGSIATSSSNKVALWMIPRIPLSASEEQIKMFRRLWDPWDEPNTRNSRPLQDADDRHIFFVNPEWSQHGSLLPIPRLPIPSISQPSPAYVKYPDMIPLLNTDLRQDTGLNEIKPPAD